MALADEDVFLGLLNRDATMANDSHESSAREAVEDDQPRDDSSLDGLLFANSLGLFDPPSSTSDPAQNLPAVATSAMTSGLNSAAFAGSQLPMLGSNPLPPATRTIAQAGGRVGMGSRDSRLAGPVTLPALTSTFNLKDLIELEVQRQRLELRKAQAEVENVEAEVQKKKLEIDKERLSLDKDRLEFTESKLKVQKEWGVTLDDAGGPADGQKKGKSTARASAAESRNTEEDDALPARNRILTELTSSAGFELARASRVPDQRKVSQPSPPPRRATNTSNSAVDRQRVEPKPPPRPPSERRAAAVREEEKVEEITEGRATRSSQKNADESKKSPDCPVPMNDRDLWTKMMIERHGPKLREALNGTGGGKTAMHTQAMQAMQTFLKEEYGDLWLTFRESGRGWYLPMARADDLDKKLSATVSNWPDPKKLLGNKKRLESGVSQPGSLASSKERDQEKEKPSRSSTTSVNKRRLFSETTEESSSEDGNTGPRTQKKRRTADSNRREEKKTEKAEEKRKPPPKGTEAASEKTSPAEPTSPGSLPALPASSFIVQKDKIPDEKESPYLPWLDLFKSKFGDARWDQFYKTTNRPDQDNMRELIKEFLKETYGKDLATKIINSNRRFLVVPTEDCDNLDMYLRVRARRWIRGESGDVPVLEDGKPDVREESARPSSKDIDGDEIIRDADEAGATHDADPFPSANGNADEETDGQLPVEPARE